MCISSDANTAKEKVYGQFKDSVTCFLARFHFFNDLTNFRSIQNSVAIIQYA